jgi:hypothetical protein
MNSPVLIKNFTAEADIAPYTIVKAGTAVGSVIPATTATESLMGVATMVSADSGERVDIILMGVAEVLYGGNVSAGDYLTSDSNGKAVAAAPAAGTNNGIIGKAILAGVSGDVGSVLLLQTRIQG